MTDYVALPIVGAIVSLVVQFIKNSNTQRFTKGENVAVVIALSVVAGGLYWIARDKAWWEATLQVLLYANGVYGVLIKPFHQ